MALLARIAKEQHRSVLAVTHDPRTLSYADRVIRIEDGRIVGEERRPEGLSYPFTIEMGGRIIGNIGYRWDAKDRAANIGYIVGEKFRRQGIATEAARAITDHAFAALKAERVWATVIEGNRGSLKVLRNCGMRLEGVLRKHTVHRGRRVDLEHYSVLRSEWKGRRKR